MATVLYRAPFTCYLYALDVAPEHENTLRDRMGRGAFHPRTLFENRPGLFRYIPYQDEPEDAPGNIYEWEVRW